MYVLSAARQTRKGYEALDSWIVGLRCLGWDSLGLLLVVVIIC
jgi:hypothetical protein